MVHVHPYHTRTVPFERRARYTRTLSQVDVREKLERNKRTNWHRSRSPYDIYHLQPLACDLLRRLLIEKHDATLVIRELCYTNLMTNIHLIHH